MKHLTLIVDGGRRFGYGHLTRTFALTQALKKGCPKICFSVFVYGDQAGLAYAESLFGKSRAFLLKDVNKDPQTILSKTSDGVLIDSYYMNRRGYLMWIHALPKSTWIMDDCRRLKYPGGNVLNPTPYGIEERFQQPHARRYVSGARYVLQRKAFWNSSRRIVRGSIQNILITLGGTATSRQLSGVVDTLLNVSTACIHVLGTPSESVRNSRVKYYENLDADKMKKLMVKCDVAVSAAGQTLYELCRMGTPTLAIKLAENQKFNMKYLCDKGIITNLGRLDSKTLHNKINSALSEYSGKAIRERVASKGQKLIDGQGALRVANLILKSL